MDIAIQQRKVIRTLSTAQILVGVGTSGTAAAGSLLVTSISKSESLAGLAQTMGVLGAAMMALPLAKVTQMGGRRLSLMSGYLIGVVGAILAIVGGTHRVLYLMLSGAFLVGAASAEVRDPVAGLDLLKDSLGSDDVCLRVSLCVADRAADGPSVRYRREKPAGVRVSRVGEELFGGGQGANSRRPARCEQVD